jgi:hypothetical protein
MKKHGFRIAMMVTLLVLVFSPLIPGPRNAFAQGACSNRTLQGDYGIIIEGGFPGPTALRGVGMAHYDGAGHFTQVDHVVVNGTPPGPPQFHPGSGTYTVNPDCTGVTTVNFTDGRPSGQSSFILVRQGAEWHLVVDNSPAGPGVYVVVTGIRRDEP